MSLRARSRRAACLVAVCAVAAALMLGLDALRARAARGDLLVLTWGPRP